MYVRLVYVQLYSNRPRLPTAAHWQFFLYFGGRVHVIFWNLNSVVKYQVLLACCVWPHRNVHFSYECKPNTMLAVCNSASRIGSPTWQSNVPCESKRYGTWKSKSKWQVVLPRREFLVGVVLPKNYFVVNMLNFSMVIVRGRMTARMILSLDLCTLIQLGFQYYWAGAAGFLVVNVNMALQKPTSIHLIVFRPALN